MPPLGAIESYRISAAQGHVIPCFAVVCQFVGIAALVLELKVALKLGPKATNYPSADP